MSRQLNTWRVLAASTAMALSAGAARAEAPATSLPLCWSPAAASMGSWTQYEISMGGPHPAAGDIRVEERVALVGSAQGALLIESQSRMAQLPESPLLVMQAALAPDDTSGRARRLLVQVEDGQPLDASAHQKQGEMPVPDLVKAGAGKRTPPRRESVPFGGTTLQATVREARDAHGLLWRAWCSEKVQPLGVVRLQVTGEKQGRKITYDMQARSSGAGARPRVVGTSVPYSDQALMRQMTEATRKRLHRLR